MNDLQTDGDSGTVLITGGSRGIGAATAVLAAKRGYDVCFSYHSNLEATKNTVAMIERTGRHARAIQADLACESDIERLWENAIDAFGPIVALVNNAAILEQQQRLVDFTSDRLKRLFQVNVIGSILCAQHAIRHMSTQRGGRGGSIVNISSVASRLGSAGEYIDYAATKGAIDTMTIGLAKEVAAEGIRVNAVRPGAIHTDIHTSGGEPDRVDRVKQHVPMKRGGQPKEIAEAILFLISDRSSYTTGTILDVAGGV